MWQSLSLRCRAASRVTTLPMSTSPPPLGYLVSACTEMSTASPRPSKLKGLKARPAPQVLSSALSTPSSRHRRACASKSGNSSVTEPAASSQTRRVRGVTRSAKSAGFMGSYT